jgi:exodeoxyribonuclease-3
LFRNKKAVIEIECCSFAARSRSLKIGQLGSLRLRVMSSKRGVSSSTKSAAASIVDDKKDSKLKGMSGDCSENVLIEVSV